jgi:hippurate hydrolase
MLASALLMLITITPVDPLLADLDAFYLQLHQHPELSNHEEKTALLLGDRLKKLGFTVTQKVGGFGVVGVLKNGAGPTVLVRTDMDALPVEEKTGLPYASKATGTGDDGQKVGVMHACGHDLHMTVWLGAATRLSKDLKAWHGTLVFIGQPAEEKGDGAKGMIAAGLFTKFPKPDVAVALHDTNLLPAGTIGWVKGPALAAVDSIDITLYGRGGHGAYPHNTVDPIVLAAKTVLSLQTLVSREMNPFEPAVVTVGSIHGGTRPNIIPDEVKLQLTVRSYSPETRLKLREGINRIVKAEAVAARSPKEPLVVIDEGPSVVFNDPKTVDKLEAAISKELGEHNVQESDRVMGAEDFGELSLVGGFPGVMLWLGAADPEKLLEAKRKNEALPSLHSAYFAPAKEKSIPTGVTALTTAVLALAK